MFFSYETTEDPSPLCNLHCTEPDPKIINVIAALLRALVSHLLLLLIGVRIVSLPSALLLLLPPSSSAAASSPAKLLYGNIFSL
jgi:hypothetical protein